MTVAVAAAGKQPATGCVGREPIAAGRICTLAHLANALETTLDAWRLRLTRHAPLCVARVRLASGVTCSAFLAKLG